MCQVVVGGGAGGGGGGDVCVGVVVSCVCVCVRVCVGWWWCCVCEWGKGQLRKKNITRSMNKKKGDNVAIAGFEPTILCL